MHLESLSGSCTRELRLNTKTTYAETYDEEVYNVGVNEDFLLELKRVVQGCDSKQRLGGRLQEAIENELHQLDNLLDNLDIALL